MPVQTDSMYRNNMPGPTYLALTPTDSEGVTWQGKGDPNGGDIQPVSENMERSIAFRNALRKGILSQVENDSEALVEYDRLAREKWERQSSSMQQQGSDALEKRADNDLITKACIGPSPKAGIACGIDVVMRERQQNDIPPLCDQHKGLAPEYVPVVEFEGGRSITRWSRITMGERQRTEQ